MGTRGRGLRTEGRGGTEECRRLFPLGLAQRGLARYDEAAASLQKALGNGYNAVRGLAALGFTKALAGDAGGASESLGKAVDQGLPAQVLDAHPALASLRSDPRFAALRKRADEKSHPCASDPKYRAFDFWVGD